MKKILLLVLPLVLLLIAYIYASYRPYNVILITIDTLRRDYLSCYSTEAPSTPNIDTISREGVQFNNAYSLIPITLPAHSAILSSHPPYELSVFNNGDIFRQKVPLLAEVLAKEGYQTAAFVSLAVLKSDFGLSKGFQLYDDSFNNSRWYRIASEMNDVALPWIKKQRENQFFAWIHYSDPHEPYLNVDTKPDTEIWINGQTQGSIVIGKKQRHLMEFTVNLGDNVLEFRAISSENADQAESNARVVNKLSILPAKEITIEYGEGWQERLRPNGVAEKYFTDRALVKVINKNKKPVKVRLTFKGDIDQSLKVVLKNYSSEVQYVDQHVGQLWKLLKDLGIRDRTIVIITADHGEGLGTHGRIGHLFPLYQENLRVPLIVYYPGLGRTDKKSENLVSHLDIMPTILQLVHAESPGLMRGQSLKHEITWTPLDWLFSRKLNRPRTFMATYEPQGRSNSFAVIQGKMKLIETRQENGWKWEAYDLDKDPMERINLAPYDPMQFQSQSISLLRPFLEEYGKDAETVQLKHKNPELSDDDKRMLRDLGYVSP